MRFAIALLFLVVFSNQSFAGVWSDLANDLSNGAGKHTATQGSRDLRDEAKIHADKAAQLAAKLRITDIKSQEFKDIMKQMRKQAYAAKYTMETARRECISSVESYMMYRNTSSSTTTPEEEKEEEIRNCRNRFDVPGGLIDIEIYSKKLENYLQYGTCIERHGFLGLKKRQVHCSLADVQAKILGPMAKSAMSAVNEL